MPTPLRSLHPDPAPETHYPPLPHRQRLSSRPLLALGARLIRVRWLLAQHTCELLTVRAARIRAKASPIPPAINQLPTAFCGAVHPIRIIRFGQPLGEALAERPVQNLLSDILGPEAGTAAVGRREIHVVEGDLEGSHDAGGAQRVLGATAGDEIGKGLNVQAPSAFFRKRPAVTVQGVDLGDSVGKGFEPHVCVAGMVGRVLGEDGGGFLGVGRVHAVDGREGFGFLFGLH